MASLTVKGPIAPGGDYQTIGTSGDDALYGNLPKLTGSASFTQLFGGLGNDTYFIDAAGGILPDLVVEQANAGTDTVVLTDFYNGSTGYWGAGWPNYALPDNVENLQVQGSAIVDASGKQIDNAFPYGLFITGNVLNNAITTGSGNDTLLGGGGADTLAGGLGNDVYIVDSLDDKVVEIAGFTAIDSVNGYSFTRNGGNDTVYSTVDFTLGSNVENLALDFNSAAVKAGGNELANAITGNKNNNLLSGSAGNDTLFGVSGSDTLLGGDGNDLLVGDRAGTTVNLSTGAIAAITPAADGHDTLDGGSGNDTLYGGDGSMLLGGIGNDMLFGNALYLTGYSPASGVTANEKLTLDGGLGDDIYQNFGINDILLDAGGIDTAYVGFNNYTLANGIERGILTDDVVAAISLTGNAGNNYLQGNQFNNSLVGLAGDDVLDGGRGTNTLVGGDGNDSYVVNTATDVVVETNALQATGGKDTVYSYIQSYSLGANVENLVLAQPSASASTIPSANSTPFALIGTGNELDNFLLGNSLDNTLTGGAGNDTLDGGTGVDMLIGGSGNDTYLVDNYRDKIMELADFTASNGSSVSGGTDTVKLTAAFMNNGVFSYSLLPNLENLDASAVQAVGTSSVGLQLNGNSSNNTIIGSNQDDTLDGGKGLDTMQGGLGNDVYYVANAADVVTEAANGGHDTIYYSATTTSYTLAANVEDLVLLTGTTATGNILDNNMTGNSSGNILDGGIGNDSIDGGAGNDSLTGGAGNDTLYGGTGDDTLNGGAGDDSYYVDSVLDVITADSAGVDSVYSYVDYRLALGSGLDNLTLLGDAHTATGNELANRLTGSSGKDTLTGGAGNDTLDGGAGADNLAGGSGNDTYLVDNAGDVVVETVTGAAGGVDLVLSSVDFKLGGNLENLTLTGTGNINGTGNDAVNTITGNSGDNTLDGGQGADSLIGGNGDDVYLIDNVNDRILETATGGYDSIQASLASGSSYSMDANVEEIYLLAKAVADAAAVNVTGNDSDNTIVGGAGANLLDGGKGDDNLQGRGGNDTLLGGNGNDVLDGDSYDWYGIGNYDSSIVGNDSMAGGSGDDIYLVNSGDGAGTAFTGNNEDQVVESLAGAAGGNDSVYLYGNTISNYVLSANIENLDMSLLTEASDCIIAGVGNALDNTITGSVTSKNVLMGGAGNDKFILQYTSQNSITDDAIYGGDKLADSGNDTLTATTSNISSVHTRLTTKGVENIALTLSNTSDFLWITNIDRPCTMTVSALNATNAQVNGLKSGNTYALNNFRASNLTLALADATASNDSLNISLDYVNNARLIAAGIETLKLASNGTLFQSNAPTNSLDVSGVTTPGGLTLIDVTGDTAFLLRGLATNNQTVNLHDFNGSQFAMLLSSSTGLSDVSTLQVNNVATLLQTDANALETLNIQVAGSAASTLDARDNLLAAQTIVSGVGELVLNNFGGGTLTTSAGNAALQLLINRTIGTALNYIENGNNNVVINAGSNVNDTYNFGTGLNDKDVVNDTGGIADTLNATLDAAILNANGNGNLHLHGIETINFTLAGSGTINLDGQQITGNDVLNLSGNSGATLTMQNVQAGLVKANQVGNSDTLNLFFNDNSSHSYTAGGGANQIVGSSGTHLALNFGNTLDNQDTIIGSFADADSLTFTAANTNSNALDNVSGIQSLTLGNANTNIMTQDSLVIAGETMFVDAGNIAGANSFVWDGHNETGGSFRIIAGSSNTGDNLKGGAGDDSFYLGVNLSKNGVIDTLDGGSGFDTLYFNDNGSGNTDLNGVTNVENIVIGNANSNVATLDSLVAAGMVLQVSADALSAAKTLFWDGHNETDGAFSIRGGGGADTLLGGGGNDTINGMGGIDSINGGAGDDLINMDLNNADSIDAGPSGTLGDTLLLSGNSTAATTIDFSVASNVDQIALINGSAENLIQANFENLDAGAVTGSGISFKGSAAANSVIGSSGNDTLDGFGGADSINAGSGDDRVSALTVANLAMLDGGDGLDTLVLSGTTFGTSIIDLSVVAGNDQITALNGATDSLLQANFEHIDGSGVAGAGGFNIKGSGTDNSLNGGAGNDTLSGGDGNDSLSGNGGNDTLIGGSGENTLTGGAGSDQFTFTQMQTIFTPCVDQITDFVSGTDKLAFSKAVFGGLSTAVGGNVSTEFTNAAQAATTAQHLIYDNSNGNLYYDADGSGVGEQVLIAILGGHPGLNAADISIIA